VVQEVVARAAVALEVGVQEVEVWAASEDR
jgi:hypothetical protein